MRAHRLSRHRSAARPDYPRTATITRRKAVCPTSAPVRTMVPSARVNSILASIDGEATRDGSDAECDGESRPAKSFVIRTGKNTERATPNLTSPVPQQASAYLVPTRDLNETGTGLLRLSQRSEAYPPPASVVGVQPR
jgi:hypothetical protein